MIICLAVVLAWFSPWWLTGKNLAPLDLLNEMMSPWRGTSEQAGAKNHIVSDAVDQYLVYRMVAAENYRREGWLGWSSLTYGGTAEYANTMALYYDWTMQLHRWFSFWTAWHLGIIAQVLLASTGMLLFLRGRCISLIWSCCGALAYAANSQFVTWIYHRWTLSAFCWVPWILWSIDGYRKGKRFHWTLVPIFIGMGFLGGTLQHASLLVLAVTAIWAEEALQGKRMVAPQTRILARYLTWGILGVGCAAMMFLPCIAAFLESSRLGLHIGMYGHKEMGVYPSGWLQPLCNLAAYPFQIFPSLLGRCDSLDLLKLFKSEMFYTASFGSLPVLIAFIALWKKDSPVLPRLLIAAGLLLPLTPLVRVLYQRLFILFILGGIIAFAHFMENAGRETRLKIFKASAWVTGTGIFIWCILSVTLAIKTRPLDALREKLLVDAKGSSFGYFDGWIASRVDHFIADLFIWSPHQLLPLALLVGALAGLRLTASLQGKWRSSGSILVALAVVCEVTFFASRWVTFTDPQKYPLYPITPEVTALQNKVGHDGRVTTVIHPSTHLACTPFVPNTLSPYGVATISGYDSIVPDGMVLPIESTGDAEKLGRFGVSHLITYPDNRGISDDWTKIWESPSMALFENTKAVPRYIGFGSAGGKDTFFKSAADASWVGLKENSHLENSRTIQVPAGINWIRIAENQASGWEFRVKGYPTETWQPVQRAADASMLLPLGKNFSSTSVTVEMRFAPPLRRTGFEISALALLLTIFGGLTVLKRTGNLTIDRIPC